MYDYEYSMPPRISQGQERRPPSRGVDTHIGTLPARALQNYLAPFGATSKSEGRAFGVAAAAGLAA